MCESCNLILKFCNTFPSESADLRCVKTYSQFKIFQMKKLTLGLMTAFMLLTIIPMQSNAARKTNPTTVVATKPVESAEALAEDNAIIARLNEIKAMDMSKLSSAEKKELRKEVRQDRVRIRSHGYIYFGGGTLLLLIILIILLG